MQSTNLDLTPVQMLEELRQDFPQFQESLTKVLELYNSMMNLDNDIKDMQKEIGGYIKKI